MGINKQISINLILNTGGRLDMFKDIFSFFSKKGAGKLTDSHFIIDTTILLDPRSPAEFLFTKLQKRSNMEGFKYNCFCFKIDA